MNEHLHFKVTGRGSSPPLLGDLQLAELGVAALFGFVLPSNFLPHAVR